MQVVVSEQTTELIAQRAGCLYVWPKKQRCCGGATTLVTSAQPKAGTTFTRVPDVEQFALYLPTNLARTPSELHLDVARFPERIQAFWDGCVWVV